MPTSQRQNLSDFTLVLAVQNRGIFAVSIKLHPRTKKGFRRYLSALVPHILICIHSRLQTSAHNHREGYEIVFIPSDLGSKNDIIVRLKENSPISSSCTSVRGGGSVLQVLTRLQFTIILGSDLFAFRELGALLSLNVDFFVFFYLQVFKILAHSYIKCGMNGFKTFGEMRAKT